MLHTPDNCKDKVLVDHKGKRINMVRSFDDETEEAEIYLTATNGNHDRMDIVSLPDGEYLSVKVKIPGAKLVSKKQ